MLENIKFISHVEHRVTFVGWFTRIISFSKSEIISIFPHIVIDVLTELVDVLFSISGYNVHYFTL